MSLTTPVTKDQLAQELYKVAARTGVELNAERLEPTLTDAQSVTGDTRSSIIHVLIDGTSPASLRKTAAQVREIADLIEAAADKPRGAA